MLMEATTHTGPLAISGPTILPDGQHWQLADTLVVGDWVVDAGRARELVAISVRTVPKVGRTGGTYIDVVFADGGQWVWGATARVIVFDEPQQRPTPRDTSRDLPLGGPTVEVRLPGRAVDLLDCTSWGTATDNGPAADRSARAKLASAPTRKVGRGSQLVVQLDRAELTTAAQFWSTWADAADEAVRDTFRDARWGGADALRNARAEQAEARLGRTCAERFAAARDELEAAS